MHDFVSVRELRDHPNNIRIEIGENPTSFKELKGSCENIMRNGFPIMLIEMGPKPDNS